ncbi:Na+/H+ antiporter subunit G [uncultured Corynebacterium sp.]|uniref:Na+/H+ antiporter subunit G n=1 Tax=uncultured Corynebacterium sp. TaxID=159447 RepID=UPI0025F666A7|nr:Na+/H+ antiporter subunit G [uncultured Corynebacterium sp.]
MTGSLTVLAAETGQMRVYQDLTWWAAVVVGVLALAGALFILVSAVAMYLAPDALSQVNMLGPAMGMGLPLLIIAHLVYSWTTTGFNLGELLEAVGAIGALLIVQAVGSYVVGRALHATHWDHTVPLSGGEREPEKD